MVQVAVKLPMEAVIFAVPAAFAVIFPLWLTDATDGRLLLNVAFLPLEE